MFSKKVEEEIQKRVEEAKADEELKRVRASIKVGTRVDYLGVPMVITGFSAYLGCERNKWHTQGY